MYVAQNHRKLSGLFYSNLIILSSVFRPLDIIYSFVNEYLNSKLRYNRYFWKIFNIFLGAIYWTKIILTMFE